MKLSFKVDKLPFYCVSVKNGRKTLEIQALEGILKVAVQYDFDLNPLVLKGKIEDSTTVDVVLFDHRIELYIDGQLKDEEWPAGNRLYEMGDSFFPYADIRACEYAEEVLSQPSVIGSFENAEGWYPGDGVFVGDCMPYRKDDEYHVLYLKDRHHHRSKWILGAHQWEHISTKDFKTWLIHPMAVAIEDSCECSICTGSWIREGNKEYLYYTIRHKKGVPRYVRRSISEDGYHFVKDKDFGFIISDKYDAATVRDPKVVKGEDGLFHMFLTTSIAKENKGCLAHYVSADMEKWEEAPEPIYVAPGADQPECPDYFQYKGKYYLIFSLQAKARYMVSDQPYSGFVMPENPMIPCENVPKVAEWDGRLIFVGYRGIDGYAGSMTFKAATALDNGELIFEEL